MSKVLYIGFAVAAKANVHEILGEPSKPGNWKDETYQERLPELRAKQAETAHNDLRGGSIEAITVIDAETDKEQTVTLKELQDLVETGNDDVYIVGFSPEFRLRQASWEQRGGPTWVWCAGWKGVEMVDLYKLSGAKHDSMRLVEMVNYWLPEGIKAQTASSQEARAAIAIAKKMGLTAPEAMHYA